MISVKNPYNRLMHYNVETDLVNSWGISHIEIPPNGTYQYQLNVNPLFGGVYTGQITFQERDDPSK